MSLLCRSSFGVMPQIMENREGDTAVEQIVASRATEHGGNHGSGSAVEQIVASRATDHGGRRARYLQRHVPMVVQTFQFSLLRTTGRCLRFGSSSEDMEKCAQCVLLL